MQPRTIDLDGAVHYADFGGEGRPIVLVHGLGGSHLNWLPVAPRLAALGRVVAPDLAGHGRTRSQTADAKAGRLARSASVEDNLVLLGRFLDAVAKEPAVLIGNSMGGYLALATAAAFPTKVSSLVLVDPAVPTAPGMKFNARTVALFAGMMLPGIGEAMMRRRAQQGPERSVRDIMALCTVDPGRIAKPVFDAHIELSRERAGYLPAVGHDFLAAQRSLVKALVRRRRFAAMVASIRAPGLIVQGERDRLVHVEAARALARSRPDWQLEVLDDVGHIPQLEAPERFLAVVEPWLRAHAAAPG